MESRLRAWAETGQYTEEERHALDRSVRSSGRSAGIRQQALVGLLVPIGVVVGVLLAGAMVVRLVSLPFAAALRSRQAEGE
jgi:hypothetical protein